MTITEKKNLRRAISLLLEDNEFENAMDILYKLLGKKNHVLDTLKSLRLTPLCELPVVDGHFIAPKT